MEAVNKSGGAIVVVEEEEIVTSFNTFARRGFFVEPTSATAGAVLSRLIRDEVVADSEATVIVLTGHGLKAVEKIVSFNGVLV